MKTTIASSQLRNAPPAVRLHRLFRSTLLAASGLAIIAPVSPISAASAGAESDKSYAIFLGLTVFVEEQGKKLPVVGGSDPVVLVREDGTNVDVPRRHVALSAVVEPTLSPSFLTLDALNGYPIHSPATNPVRDAQAQMIAMQGIDADRQDASAAAWRQADTGAVAATAQAAATDASSPDKGLVEGAAAAARGQAASALDNMTSTITNPLFGSVLPGSGETGSDATCDGFEVTFRASASEPCSNVYGVLRLLIRPPAPANGELLQALKVFRLPDLDARPRKIVVRRLDMPVGAKVESFDVHIYANGRELASNTSRNRVDVSDDEALQFLILRHMQGHAKETLPAEVAQELRPGWPGVISKDATKLTVDVGIDAEGKVSAVSLGVAATTPSAAELERAVRNVRFLPALLNGKPAPSSGTFALGELFRASPEL